MNDSLAWMILVIGFVTIFFIIPFTLIDIVRDRQTERDTEFCNTKGFENAERSDLFFDNKIHSEDVVVCFNDSGKAEIFHPIDVSYYFHNKTKGEES